MNDKKKRSLNSPSRDNIKDKRGRRCAFCSRRREKIYLEIHHVNLNKHDNTDKNLMILCGDNTRQKCHEKLHAIIGSLKSGDREKERIKNATEKIKKAIDYQTGSAEMGVNDLAEMPYRNWIFAMLKNVKKYPKKQAINAGAEVTGINPTTVYKYYNKLISDAGPLFEFKDPENFNQKMVSFKKHYYLVEAKDK